MNKNTKLLQDLLKFVYEHHERIVKLERIALKYLTEAQNKEDSSDPTRNLNVYLLQEAEEVRKHIESHNSQPVFPLVKRLRKSGEAS